jgi:hypothetical protein
MHLEQRARASSVTDQDEATAQRLKRAEDAMAALTKREGELEAKDKERERQAQKARLKRRL